MTIMPFTQDDFNAFHIQGLEPRMAAIIANVRPKLQLLGDELQPFLSTLTGEPMFPHVARHARRKINPPNDTWVAWSNNKRGYKAQPHFQVGLYASHIFVLFAVIYESDNKSIVSKYLHKKRKEIKKIIPDHYVWSMDHMQPEATRHDKLKLTDFSQMSERLVRINKAELLCGIHVDKDDPLLQDGDRLQQIIEETFRTLVPLYRNAF